MLINISELLNDTLFVQPIEVGKTTRTIDDLGNPQESITWSTVMANVQAVSDDALQQLSEANRYKPSRQFFTNRMEVRIGDYFKYRGETYRCMTDQDFEDYGYSDCIGVLYSGVETDTGGFVPPYED